ncbi:CoA ester lyase [Deinococcus metallilatus]|uniref:Citrate lyase subunit beta/citryl-CoA lyase n=1 Tax=Deinococcus metallilatus TaxID=1211322 RepID=A0AAJ5F171_9DEIO|nr:CoA ester lyase [Deinococcus metallilatus]MBB5297023.1 citrate lyase subunit beta/citryl-CoA lyase [Deinococcus metallilatus]QBY07847.1 CoA ester lyase [Deinococcus metallilatus]RXJ13196.1 CoA ester lyase [Deinococcus metallilatus]TLK23031.1 CoA ester lyase [Deinococcus metallilatus]GMA15989.1 CoA ester lyase [Deinococcus metallilatus]
MSVKPWRSVLYVPGDKPRAIEKARTLRADAVILDLEDAVAPEHKDAARGNVKEALAWRWPGPLLVRVNGLGTPWEYADREMALLAGVDGLVLPKVEDAGTVRDLHLRVPLWAMIETPLGVLRAPEIAAVPGVAGLIVGTNDLARALRTRPHPGRLPLLHALSAVVLAARAHGKLPLDAVFNDVRDPEGFARECEQGRTLGFAGKTVIHPDQVEPANAAFGVTDVEADEARALLAAWEQARAEGRSVATYLGALVEQMHVEEARERLAIWEETRPEPR